MSRKAAQSLPAGRASIRQDADGFDDLDEYFAASPAKPRGREKSWEVTETSTSNNNQDDTEEQFEYVPSTVDEYGAALGPDEVLVDVRADDDICDENQDQANAKLSPNDDDDSEVSFKAGVKVTRSPEEKAHASSLAASAKNNKSKATLQRTRSTKAPSRKTPRSRFEPLVDLKSPTASENVIDDFNRHSKRQKMAPLAFWRNEKVIYGRRQSARMPVIVDVLRKDAAQSPTKQPGKIQSGRQRKQKKTDQVEGRLRAAGFCPKVSVEASVIDFETHEPTRRCTIFSTPIDCLLIGIVLALSSDQVKAKTVSGEDFAIQTIFTEGSFLSSGILEFPPKSSKPSRNSSKHVLVLGLGLV